MTKRSKEIGILIILFLFCLGLWLYIWDNLRQVVKEYEANYTGVVTYAWRWEKLPINLYVDPAFKIEAQELKVIVAHFNYFFQARYHSDMIVISSEPVTENQAYLNVEKYIPKEMDAYTEIKGYQDRPAIFISDRYLNWTSEKLRGVIMHELGHLVGLPHLEVECSLMRSVQNPPQSFVSEVEQELIYLLYARKLGDRLISP